LCTVTRPAGGHAMVVAHFFESASDPSTWASRERTDNGRRSSDGQHRVHRSDQTKRAWGVTSVGRASRVPHSVSRHCTETGSRTALREAQGRVILFFWSGGWIAASCGGRDRLVVRRTVPLRSLENGSSLRVSIALPLRFYYDVRNPPQNICGSTSNRNTT